MSDDQFRRAADDVLARVRREKLRWTALIATLAAIVLLMATLSMVTYVNFRSDAARQESLEDLERLCREGKIDCTGSDGLPGPKGPVGGRIKKISCTRAGAFRFDMTTGETFVVGDCIAEAGPAGKVGKMGPRGFTGKMGPRGKAGPKGKPGRPGKGNGRGRR